jgi:hypothetical protein
MTLPGGAIMHEGTPFVGGHRGRIRDAADALRELYAMSLNPFARERIVLETTLTPTECAEALAAIDREL